MGLASTIRSRAVGVYLERGPAVVRGWHGFKRVITRGPRTIRFYYQVDDPYSYLLAQALQDVYRRIPSLKLETIVVPPPAADADPEPHKRLRFAIRDCGELARQTTLHFPDDAPVPADDRVRRINAVLLESRPAAEWLERAVRLGSALWNDDAEALATAVREFGTVAGQTVTPLLEANYKALRKAGHYMGAMLHYGGEWFWGVDRLPHLVRQLADEGITEAWEPVVRQPSEANDEGEARPEFASSASGLECWFSFRSPYSYLALAQLEPWRKQWPDLELRLRPVLPMVSRGLPVPRDKVLYIAKDAKRVADTLSIPLGNVCDPLGDGVSRCLAVFDAVDRERGGDVALSFAVRAFEGIWARGVDVSSSAGLLAVAKSAGVDDLVESALQNEAWRERCEANRVALNEAGLWGVPCFRLGEWSTWGQDRLWMVEGRIQAAHAGAGPVT